MERKKTNVITTETLDNTGPVETQADTLQESNNEQPPEGVPVYIASKGKDTRIRKESNGKEYRVIEGSINGKKFAVRCDVPTFVTQEQYDVIKPMLDYEQGILHKNPEDI